MEAYLEVLSGSLEGERFALLPPKTSVGRDPGQDIVFSEEREPTVSRIHATIQHGQEATASAGSDAGARTTPVWFLVDEGAANGTFLNGRRIEPRERVELAHGDEITFGRDGPVARFLLEPARTRIVPSETRLAGGTAPGGGKTKLVRDDPKTRFDIEGNPPEATLQILSGSRKGESFSLSADGARWTRIGRAPESDLAFSEEHDPTVSRYQALLRYEPYPRTGWREDRWFVQDQDSTNGTYVNGERLEAGEEREIFDGDELTFGRDGPVARFTAKGGSPATRRGGRTVPWPGSPGRERPGSPDDEESVPGPGGEPTLPVDGEEATEPVGSGLGPMWLEETEPIRGRTGRSRTEPGSTRPRGEGLGEGTMIRRGTTWIVNNVSDWDRKLRLLYERQKRKMWRAVGATAALGVLVAGGVFAFGEYRNAQLTRQLQAAENRAVEAEGRIGVVLDSLTTQMTMAGDTRRRMEQRLAGLQAEYDALRQQQEAQAEALDARLGFSEAIAAELRGGTAMIQSMLRFREVGGSRYLRLEITPRGELALDTVGFEVDPVGDTVPTTRPRVVLGGSGPLAELPGSGTAFLVHADGWLLSNAHVAEALRHPELVETAASLSVRVGRPLEPVFEEARAFFPGAGSPVPFTVEALSPEVDVALARTTRVPPGTPILPLAPAGTRLQVGQDIAVMGFPAGLRLLLGRATGQQRNSFLNSQEDEFTLAEMLAQAGLIDPFLTSGRISDLSPERVAYTAGTTGGSSGGPVLDVTRQVVGVHFASFRPASETDPFRPGYAVPIRYAWDLLPPDVRRDLEAAAVADQRAGTSRAVGGSLMTAVRSGGGNP